MTSNTSNTSNSTAGSGNAGSSTDPGTDWTFPDRANLPFIDDPGIDGLNQLPDKPYPDRFWSPIWNAWRILPQYSQLDWAGTDPGAPVVIGDEFQTLANYTRFERGDALAEILAQKDEFISYFMGLLAATPASHPDTYRLMHLLNLFGAFTVMHFKDNYRRLRPSQRFPPLLPQSAVPGHASYPSGHATQARLIARGLGLIIPAMTTDLNGLAARIARNRELAGFHYPSDTTGGVRLADNIFDILEADRAKPALNPPEDQIVPGYADAVEAARKEWP